MLFRLSTHAERKFAHDYSPFLDFIWIWISLRSRKCIGAVPSRRFRCSLRLRRNKERKVILVVGIPRSRWAAMRGITDQMISKT